MKAVYWKDDRPVDTIELPDSEARVTDEMNFLGIFFGSGLVGLIPADKERGAHGPAAVQ